MVQESGGVPNQLLLVGSLRCSFSGVCCSSFHRTPCARFCDLWLEKRFTIRNFHTPSLTCLTGSLVVVWIRSLLNANQQPMVMMVAADRVCALIFDIFPTFLHSLFLSGDSFSSLFFRGFLYSFRRIPNHYTFHVWILDFPGYPPGGSRNSLTFTQNSLPACFHQHSHPAPKGIPTEIRRCTCSRLYVTMLCRFGH